MYFTKITKWLKVPYYFNPSFYFKLKLSTSFSLFVFLFLFFFKPFQLSEFELVLLIQYTLFIAFFTFINILFVTSVLPLIFKKYFDEDNWTVGKTTLIYFFTTIVTAIILKYLGDFYIIKTVSLSKYIFYSVLVSSFPFVFFIVNNERTVRLKRNEKAKRIISNKKETKKNEFSSENIKIYAQNNKEYIKIETKDLLYITCQGNYASFFLRKNGIIKEKILRTTLANIEKEFKNNPKIIRCHKSFIVNTNYILDITGNARGYILSLKNIENKIPVSRSFSKQSLDSYLQ